MYGTSPPAIAGGIVFSNVTAPSDPAFPGYEMWVDKQGFMRVRVIHDASVFNMIGMIGTVFLADGKQHMLCRDLRRLVAGGGHQALCRWRAGHGRVQRRLVPDRQHHQDGSGDATSARNRTRARSTSPARSATFSSTMWCAARPTSRPLKTACSRRKDAQHCMASGYSTRGPARLVRDTSGAALNGTLTSGNMWVP